MAFSLAAQYFQIAVYQVFLVDPPVDGTPAGHLQRTRRTGDLLWRPRCPQLFLYVVNYFLRMEHSPVAVGTPQQILLLCCVRIVGRNVVHMCAGPPYLPRHRAHVSPDQPGYLSVT